MKHARFAVVLLMLPIANAWATGWAVELADLPFEKCDWPMVHVTLSVNFTKRAAEIGSQTSPLNREIRSLADKANKKNVPIDQQLDKKDLVRLNQLMQRSNSINAALRLEANRDRDMDVFDKLLQVIDAKYRWYAAVPDNSPDAIYQSIAGMFPVLALQDPNEFVSIPKAPTCTTQVALYRLESEATAKLNKLSSSEDPSRILKVMQDMAKRYHVDNLGQAKLAPEDQKTFDEINRRYIIPMSHEEEFVKNIEAIRVLDLASEIIYTTGKQDLADSGGDGKTVGVSLDRKILNHELSERMIKAIGLMRLIGQKVPATMQLLDYPG